MALFSIRKEGTDNDDDNDDDDVVGKIRYCKFFLSYNHQKYQIPY